MTQLSRPFQIALVAMGVLVAVWFVALRGHSSNPGSSGSTAATRPPTAAVKAAAPNSVYHGSAPGVEGLTRAIAKARGAVAESERNAKRLQEKSAAASSSTSTAPAPGSSTAASRAASSIVSKRSTTTGATVTHPAVKAKATGAGTPITAGNTPPGQLWLERELNQGHTVALLFLNPTGADDIHVRHELELLVETQTRSPTVQGREVGNESAVPEPPGPEETLAMRVARASQVASFGSFTHGVLVAQTPMVLLVNPRGQVTPIGGLIDAFAVEQALDAPVQP